MTETNDSASATGASQFAEAVEAIWRQQAHVVASRLAVLRRFADGDENAREQALQVAHKLAGALGSYGRARGSEISRELEVRLAAGDSPDQLSELVDLLKLAID
ncbi:MAG: Hpt domain-containing protein [Actinomycetes bacterium]